MTSRFWRDGGLSGSILSSSVSPLVWEGEGEQPALQGTVGGRGALAWGIEAEQVGFLSEFVEMD